MEKLIILGTGNAAVTKCYNTCFAIQNKEEYFLIDTGGGNGILTQLEKAEIPIPAIHHIFISHEHTDHLLGVVWMIRMVATAMRKGGYEGNLNIYCHEDLAETIKTLCRLTIQAKFYNMIGDRIHDLEGAKKFGVPCILVGWGYGPDSERGLADAVCHSPDELDRTARELLGL